MAASPRTETEPLLPHNLESQISNKILKSCEHGNHATSRGYWASIKFFLRQIIGHDEKKRSNVGIQARMVSDAIIGLSDGLTVPFALTAGLSSVSGITARTVIFGGLAELIAGAISMGLGGYLGARSEAQSWNETKRRENLRIATEPEMAVADVKAIFASYDITPGTLDALVNQLSASPKFVEFIMEFHHGTPEPASSRALQSAFTIALGYMLGGIIPLVPYFFVGQDGPDQIFLALWISVGVMAFALFVFGYVKNCAFSGWAGWRCVKQGIYGGGQMVIVGGSAAGSAVALVRLFDGLGES
ncbi:vacuolar iron transporter Ccc1 [Pseudomassariella vexata]|uniref:Vacuolar iron transporter Ccc1 n=1 Tax=Pseudomassariella vexata TaxID=1141098 RepID=A0A1Y2DQV4_9PEZI|nr:vacuolar iron transporter Ccc1 [Pseudomassariella vexata]ORY61682.1 vacuolar iron transporter Ccc1 [Pseudomassariella vexata]